MLSRTLGFNVQPNKAIVGRNAFAHEAGIHQHGVLSNPLCYEIMTPESVGMPADRIVLGKHSGRHALMHRFTELGLDVAGDEIDALYAKFTHLADRKKKVYDQDLISMVITHRGPLGKSANLVAAQHIMKLNIAVLPGDGVGPEVTREAVRVLRAVSDFCGYDFRFEESPIGGGASLEFGSPFPRANQGALPCRPAPCCSAPSAARSLIRCPTNGVPRRVCSPCARPCGCFANLRPAIAFESIAELLSAASRAHSWRQYSASCASCSADSTSASRGPSTSQARAPATPCATASRRSSASPASPSNSPKRRSKKLVSVDKANVLETSRLWRQVVTRVAAEFPEVALEHALVDSFAMNVIT